MREKVYSYKNWFSPLMVIVLLIPICLTYFIWQNTVENIHDIKEAKFNALANESQLALQHRIDSYKQSLLGGKGFYQGSQKISRNEWKEYVNATNILKNFPGINGIGMIDEVKKEDLKSYIKASRDDNYPNFEVHPKGEQKAYFVIKYIEPVNINKEAVGLNIAFEANRYQAATHAKKPEKQPSPSAFC